MVTFAESLSVHATGSGSNTLLIPRGATIAGVQVALNGVNAPGGANGVVYGRVSLKNVTTTPANGVIEFNNLALLTMAYGSDAAAASQLVSNLSQFFPVQLSVRAGTPIYCFMTFSGALTSVAASFTVYYV